MLGKREPDIYGRESLADIVAAATGRAESHGLAVDARQSNIEGDLVGWIQEARERHDGILINAGAYTHRSIALYDALKLADKPIIEVHMSNTFARESFRHESMISPVASGIICGFGSHSYLLAVDAMAQLLRG